MKRIWVQCIKDLAQFQRDRLTMGMAFLLPLMYLIIYGFAIRLEIKNIPLIVQDFDQSFLSRGYVQQILATNQFQQVATAPKLSSLDETIDGNRAKAALIIAPDFSRRLKSDKIAHAQLLVDGIDVNNAKVITNTIRAVTDIFVQEQDLQENDHPIVADMRLWFNPGRQESLFLVPGAYALILWVYPSLFTALAVTREKEQGTIIQVYASGISALEWLLGKALAYLILGIAQTVFLIGLGSLIFGLRLQGDPLPLGIGTLLYLSDSVFFGLFFGVRSENQGEATQKVLGVGYLTSLLLSGFIYPLNNLPLPLSWLSYLIPSRYYMELTRDAFVRGTGWSSVWPIPLILGLIGMGLLFGSWKKLSEMQIQEL
jgi:ABC-2 type transport system permease protein